MTSTKQVRNGSGRDPKEVERELRLALRAARVHYNSVHEAVDELIRNAALLVPFSDQCAVTARGMWELRVARGEYEAAMERYIAFVRGQV